MKYQIERGKSYAPRENIVTTIGLLVLCSSMHYLSKIPLLLLHGWWYMCGLRPQASWSSMYHRNNVSSTKQLLSSGWWQHHRLSQWWETSTPCSYTLGTRYLVPPLWRSRLLSTGTHHQWCHLVPNVNKLVVNVSPWCVIKTSYFRCILGVPM